MNVAIWAVSSTDSDRILVSTGPHIEELPRDDAAQLRDALTDALTISEGGDET